MANYVHCDLNMLQRTSKHLGDLRELTSLKQFQVIVNNFPGNRIARAAPFHLQQQAVTTG